MLGSTQGVPGCHIPESQTKQNRQGAPLQMAQPHGKQWAFSLGGLKTCPQSVCSGDKGQIQMVTRLILSALIITLAHDLQLPLAGQ